MGTCIYCEQQGKITQEHIFPNFLLKLNGNTGITFSNAAQGYFESDAVVKDTCKKCNDGPLSRLDDYASSLCNKYFSQVILDHLTIKFDYDKLLRWVLKVTFNAQRGFSGINKPFLHLRDYMLGKQIRPDGLILLGVVMKRSFTDGQWKIPRDLRAGDIRIPEIELGLEVKFCHTLIINSTGFIVLNLIDENNESRNRIIDYLYKKLGAKEISPNTEFFTFNAESSKIDHVAHNISQSRQNPYSYPKSKEAIVGKKKIKLTGLPKNYTITRDRIIDTKIGMLTLQTESLDLFACIILYEFPNHLRETNQQFSSAIKKKSKNCFAKIIRGKNKTHVTFLDPDEPGVPHLSGQTGIEQSEENWAFFKKGIIQQGGIFLTNGDVLKGSDIFFNFVDVISINEHDLKI